jgi:CubicO group peptidase (beta-lactamase class C family)
MRRTVCLLASLGACTAPEQAPPPSPLNLKVDSLVADAMRDGKVPGLSVTIVRNDSVIHSKGYGFANLEQRIPMTDSTPVVIGSTSKTVTAFAIMQLQDAGQLALDSSVARYVRLLGAPTPGDSSSTRAVQVAQPADARFPRQTVRHLLTNVGGIPAGFSGDPFDNPDTLPGALERIVRDDMIPRRLDFEPGTGYKYSNRGFSLASLVVQDVSGMSYEQYVDDRIFAPLGMRHSTGYFWRVNDRARGYREGLDGKPVAGAPSLSREWTGSGMISSTSGDAARFLMAMLNGGKAADGKQVLSAPSVAEILRGQQPAESELGGPTTYGLGWEVHDMGGIQVVMKGGSVISMGSLFLLIPSQKTGIAIVFNLIDYGKVQLMQNLVKALAGAPTTPYQDVPPPPPVPVGSYRLAPERATALAGSYMTKAGLMRLFASGDTLHVRYEGNDFTLEATSDTSFVMRSHLRDQEGTQLTIKRCRDTWCMWAGKDSTGVRLPN